MLGKLLKYEFKATSRIFLPIYAAILLVALVNRLVRLTSSELAFNLTTIVLVGLFAALGVLTIIGVVQRFKKNLLSDEGYLMFTLPVSSKKLIMSKLITTTIWTAISGVVAIVATLILAADQNFFNNLQQVLIEIIDYLTHRFKVTKELWMILEAPFILLFSYTSFILTIYISLSTAQLPRFNKHRGIMSFVAFFVITTLIQWIGVICSQIFIPVADNELFIMTIVLIASIGLNVILFFGTDFILRKHLNLE